ncbi:hypothetical protein EFK50_01010 [Nocardioides marmoriginsengisoli]|uniref:Uncharacterized protein n=1 Tax=Nocardioides marmoriginsengisoli TaxID=661483 RepID=A0A3N0CTA8_9ACTN|nr:hypothetical protein [Nocardioides marmoriginsengisoli]RNL66236.1 hypothetical protein EFK50_01010 [Nocardioides marmoriginsengisoli]
MDLPPTFTHPSLRMGKVVEIKVGPVNVWKGMLNQPKVSEDGWEFSAIGLADEFYSAHLCLDSGGDTTSTPNVAVDQAIADGFAGSRPASLSAVPFSGSNDTDKLNYVGDLLDAWATSVSKRWRVDPDGRVIAATDPTTPTWYLAPGATQIGLADDDYASDLYLRYKSGAASYATVHVNDPTATATRRRAVPVDVTSLGVTTSGNVTNIGNGMLAKGKARYAWTNAVNPARLQLTTPGGTPACLSFVKAGDMVRSFSVINEQGIVLPYVDWIIGKAEYEVGSDTIQLAPTELAARNLGDVLSLAVS